MTVDSSADRVQKHRQNLREKGLKPLQIWVPDTSKEGFADMCHQQAVLVKQADKGDNIDNFIADNSDLRGWE